MPFKLGYRLTEKNPVYYRLDVGVGRVLLGRDEAIVYLPVGEAF